MMTSFKVVPYKNIAEERKFRLERFHFYPATMTTSLSDFVIKRYSNEGDNILDPFCGTASILRVGNILSRNGVGVDSNPLASMIAKVSLTSYDAEQLVDKLELLLDNISAIEFDQEFVNMNNLSYWFEKEPLDAIASLNHEVNLLKKRSIREFYKLTLSSIVRSISKADPNISPPVYSKYMRLKYKLTPRDEVIRRFEYAATRNIAKSQINKERIRPDSIVRIHNTNTDNFLHRDKKVYELIFTSPPYAAAQKYVRSTSLELMTIFNKSRKDLVELDKVDLGSEAVRKIDRKYTEITDKLIRVSLNKKYKMIYGRYLYKLTLLFSRIYNKLEDNGRFVFVIGENATSKGEVVSLLNPIIDIAGDTGLEIHEKFIDPIRSRNFSIKRNNMVPAMNNEYLLVFKKSG